MGMSSRPSVLCSQETTTADSTRSKTERQQRSIPSAPESFSKALKTSSGTRNESVKVHGVTLPPGFISRDTSKSQSKKSTTKQWTEEDVFRHLSNPTSVLINKAGIDADEKLIEKTFMETTAEQMEEKVEFSQKAVTLPWHMGRLGMIKNPIPWIKKKLGYEDDEEKGFHDLPFFFAPVVRSPQQIHQDVSMDLDRFARQINQSLLNSSPFAKRKSTSNLDANDSGKGNKAAQILRQTADEQENEVDPKEKKVEFLINREIEKPPPTKQEIMKAKHSSSLMWCPLFFQSNVVPKIYDQKIETLTEISQKEKTLINIVKMVWIGSSLSFLGMLLQNKFDFIGDGTPPSL